MVLRFSDRRANYDFVALYNRINPIEMANSTTNSSFKFIRRNKAIPCLAKKTKQWRKIASLHRSQLPCVQFHCDEAMIKNNATIQLL